ncbi:MAG: hypothetical protein N2043_01575 [Ignavibacterium sp.]|nr:hypothetical protein [Ignavibacterium sp.]
MTPEQKEKVQKIHDKAVELQTLIRESLSMMSVGGGHVSNELQLVVDLAQELLNE